MTIGIYRLVFSNTNKVYIGQSVQIEKRYSQHLNDMRNERSNPKLLAAYKEFGKPELDILVECTIEELDDFEEESIDIFDSVNNGFNIYRYANEAPVKKGVESGNSKYTEKQILKVFYFLSETDNSIKQISDMTEVSVSVISNISRGTTHLWLKEKYPVEFSNIKKHNDNRKIIENENKSLHNKKFYCAKYKGIVYPQIQSPEGIIYTVDNVQQFARDHNIPKSSLHRTLRKESKHCRGWKLCQEETQ
jgi:group I intron endonuclease